MVVDKSRTPRLFTDICRVSALALAVMVTANVAAIHPVAQSLASHATISRGAAGQIIGDEQGLGQIKPTIWAVYM